ncbi:MAG: efflux RND transporter periplasmic adaptor subunit [Alphaproteobacteria bacterium]|nr:efflux RND transporter periplasmic adaptor subunit [Alphaproteobacteria bacterium]
MKHGFGPMAALVIAAAVIVSVGAYLGLRGASDQSNGTGGSTAAKSDRTSATGGSSVRRRTGRRGRRGRGGPARVVVATVELRTIGNRVAAVGTGRALRSLTLTANVTGIIEDVRFFAGEVVKEGQPLVILQSEAERIAVRQTEVKLRDAEATLARYQRLAAQNALAKVQLEQARTALATAKTELEAKQYELKRRTIKAPFGGVMGITSLIKGDFLKEGTAIATIDDRSQLVVEFVISERVASQLKLGNPVRLVTPALSGRVFQGKISALDTRVDPASRTLKVHASVPNSDGRLISGMTFSVSLRIEGRKLPSMPGLAIQWDRNGAFVWRVGEGNKVQRVGVTIRRRENNMVSVEGKIAPGDKVVTEGHDNVRPGGTVTLVKND